MINATDRTIDQMVHERNGLTRRKIILLFVVL